MKKHNFAKGCPIPVYTIPSLKWALCVSKAFLNLPPVLIGLFRSRHFALS